MAAIYNDDESTDDEIGVNLQLAEKLRINRENCKFREDTSLEDSKEFKQLCNMQRKNFIHNSHSSSSSSIEVQSDNAVSGISCSDNYLTKKRQNGDKNIEQLANPKRTCLSDRFRRTPEMRDLRKKTSSNQLLSKNSKFSDHLQVQSISSSESLSNKTGEEHINSLADAEDSDFELPMKITRNCKKNVHGAKSHKTHHSLSPEMAQFSNQESKPSTSYLSRILDNSSDDESKPVRQNGALKGGRPESLDHTYHLNRFFGHKVNKKLLDSDESEDDGSVPVYRSRPLVFSSSESEKDFRQSNSPNRHGATCSGATGHSLAYGDGHHNPRNYKSYRSKKHSLHSSRIADNSDACNSQFLSDFQAKPPSTRSCRAHRSPRMNLASSLASNNYSNGNNLSGPVRGRRIGTGDRGSRRSGSPRHRNPSSRLRSDNSKCRGRSASSSRSYKDETNYCSRYPDVFDAEESDNEFFTANSYSDAETTSTESLGGVTINASFPSHRGTISCSIDCEGDGSTDDEIRVVFSTGPYARNSESRRGTTRTLGRRHHRGSTPHRQLQNAQEVVSLSPDPVEQVRQVEEDERMARMLQAQFDAEVDPEYIPPALNFAVDPSVDTDDDEIIDPVGDSDSEEGVRFSPQSIEYVTYPGYRISRVANRPATPNLVPPVLFGGNTRRHGGRSRRRIYTPRETADIQIARLFGIGISSMSDIFGTADEYETLLNLDLGSEVISRGLHKSDINRLPTRKYIHPNSASSSSNSEGMHKRTELNKECQVCLTDYETGDILRILPCFHEFHTPCIDPWLKINHTCPVCRVTVDLDT